MVLGSVCSFMFLFREMGGGCLFKLWGVVPDTITGVGSMTSIRALARSPVPTAKCYSSTEICLVLFSHLLNASHRVVWVYR